MAAVGSGLYVQVYNLPYLGAVDIGWIGIPATLAWILFATNAMNFIDGLNGLCAGVALVSCAFLAGIAASQDGWFVYFAALLLGAGLLGFLPFNFPRARIFLGDVGSQFCGFVLAVLGVAASRFGAVEMSFLIVPMLLSGVLFDVAFTLVRRLLAGSASPRRIAGICIRWPAAPAWTIGRLPRCIGFLLPWADWQRSGSSRRRRR